MKLSRRSSSSVGGEENPKPSNKRVSSGGLTTQIGHNARDNHLLHPHLPQSLFEVRVLKRAVRVLLHHLLRLHRRLRNHLRDELRLGGAVDDEVAEPPLPQHATVVARLVAVAREDDGKAGTFAEGDGSGYGGEDGFGHGREVVLHVDY